MNRIVCTISIGYDALFENGRSSLREAARRWGADYFEILSGNGVHEWEEKLHIDKHFGGECRVLYYDADVVIRHDCPNPFDVVPEGSLGWIPGSHFSNCDLDDRTMEILTKWCHKVEIDLAIDECPITGMMLFELPRHRELFEEARRLVAKHGFNPDWAIADRGNYAAARKTLNIPVFWIPPIFAWCGNRLLNGWTAEMKTVGYHFSGLFDRASVIPRTVWDNLGPDRNYLSVKRWQTGKPVCVIDGQELPMFIREVSKVRLGRIVEVGAYLGGLTWWGAQIARDNYSEWHVVDHWEGVSSPASHLSVNEDHFNAFLINMRESELDDVVQIHKKPSVEAAAEFADGSLDLVFLDGDHCKASVLADIDAWWPKLMVGGVMLGHDYCNKPGYGVIEAVSERFGNPDSVSVGDYPIWKKIKSVKSMSLVSAPQIYACATIYEDLDGYTPHFIDHYVKLGVDRILLLVNGANNEALVDYVRACAKGKPVTVLPVFYSGVFSDSQKDNGEAEALAQHVGIDDWVLHLDLDEFHYYPFPLRQVCEAQNSVRAPVVTAEMTDRLSEDGRLPTIAATPSIFEQFPWGCNITRDWLYMLNRKVMLCKGWVKLATGRHKPLNAPIRPPVLGNWQDYKVFHFKFVRSLRDRCQQRAAINNLNHFYRMGSWRMANSIKNDRIDPKIAPSVHWCGPVTYPT